MIKKLVKFGLLIVIMVGLVGCFEEEMTCDNEVAQSIVEELSHETIMYNLMIEERNKDLVREGKDPIAPQARAFVITMIVANSANNIMGEIATKVKKGMKPGNFSLDSFMTTKKDKELSQVECSAIAHYRYDNEVHNFNTTYTAQLTDNKEEVFVTLNSFEFKAD